MGHFNGSMSLAAALAKVADLIEAETITITREEMIRMIGNASFVSATFRLKTLVEEIRDDAATLTKETTNDTE